jgi:molybdopterin converting factor small subunit
MKVRVSLFGGLAERVGWPERTRDVDLGEGARLSGLLATLGFERGRGRIVVVDNTLAGEDSVIEEGANVSIFPSIGGG